MQTIIDMIKEAFGDTKPTKSLLLVFAALGILSLVAIQIIPFLIFLLLAIIVYLQLPKK
ncbi:hypothetical protein KBD81_01905 [Candidatus Woesebacteria bacterium]|nr:hypothetical protein [Candidatus Woesebacteria bacterium]